MHLHKFGKWEDVKLGDKVEATVHVPGIFLVRQVITQQRRCSICNLVKTRVS